MEIGRLKIIGLIVIVISMYGCGKTNQLVADPYFGNGVHNGWADQNSVVIWTRLTKNKEMNNAGKLFLIPSKEEHTKLAKTDNLEVINQAQIPDGAVLDDMKGACPGISGEVKLTYFPKNDPQNKTQKDWVKVDDDKNFTKQWKLENLSSGTDYVIEIEARANKNAAISDKVVGAFKTSPNKDQTENIDFCIVTCHDYIRKDDEKGHKIYEAMSKIKPDFYVHTGDIEYYDKPKPYALTEELMRFQWDRLFALPLQRSFWANTTSYFMKDDHDVLKDDAFPGQTYGDVSWDRGLEIFEKEQFPQHHKYYKTVRWGKDLQIWITEGRKYRSKNSIPDGVNKTILGEAQKQWLFKTIKESDATFKVIILADPILGPDRENKSDNHANVSFKTEGDQLRSFINQYDNVFLCNGDRHWQYVTNLKDTNLWEFSCGPGSDSHAGGWKANDIRPEHKFLRVKGGFLKVNVSRSDDVAEITFSHCDVNGNIVNNKSFKR
ncbi:alkaline phosphatase D family protein [Tamlana sp. 2201CG12-4]|uniref:alkaline phosphatase D family protein n=1 Tax=Tamlana sp. 2201CG12-4 TaxID=3112582 RepID=UPI002DB934F7|nr:alkaline phosphatase D family protein [Tamlana sp. 2201CG12-4]MEC3907763.1 alkaline phosphatase D family protein [Tamlana sp. 2201CG12-4]